MRSKSLIKLNIGYYAVHHPLVQLFYTGVSLVSVHDGHVLHFFVANFGAVFKIIKAIIVSPLLINVL